jgi:hypothetical protein
MYKTVHIAWRVFMQPFAPIQHKRPPPLFHAYQTLHRQFLLLLLLLLARAIECQCYVILGTLGISPSCI